MHALARRLGGVGEFGRRVMLLAGGTALGRAVVILSAPLLTRLYTPHDFGMLAVFSALLTIIGALVCLRYELAIPLPGRERTAAALLVLCLLLSVATAVLCALIVWLMGERVSVWLGVPALAPYLWLMPVGLLGIGSYQGLSYWAIRRQAFQRLARTRIAQGVGQVAVQLAWGVAAGGVAGLLAGSVIGQAAGVTTLASDLHHNRKVFRSLNLRALRWVMRRYLRFPLLATGAALLNASARQLPALLLAMMFGPQVAGLYAFGQRVIRTPMQVVGSAVAQAYTDEAARIARQNRSSLRRLVLRLTGRMLLIGGLPLGLIALGGPRLFEVGFGPEWGEAGRYVQILAIAYLGQFIVAPIVQTLQILERQDIDLLWNGAQVAVMVLIFLFGYWLAWTPFTLLAAYSVGMTLSYCGAFLLVWMETSRSRPGTVSAEATGSQPGAAP